ncbi:MAG: FAD-dependent oxidoreductase [Nitrospirota bacterium]
MNDEKIIILGGGLAGLSSGYVLSSAGKRVLVFESNSTVGGLAKTIAKGEFRFDLGGHRFFTKNERIERFVKELLDGELLVVSRKSKIYLCNKYFDYPLKPANAIFNLGIPTTLKIISDYSIERLKNLVKPGANISLEDWVVGNFGRTMFNLYFKEYSEKVWGTECNRISMEWVAQRIKGLSLSKAIKNAFFRFSGKDIATLADNFLYPSSGIGRISEKLKEGIDKVNTVFTDTNIIRLNHNNFRIESVIAKNRRSRSNCDNTRLLEGSKFISSIPLTTLVKRLHPSAPEDVLTAVSMLRYRDLVIVAIMLNREKVTDQTWIYIPERKIPFGRIHEPKNWSMKMAPADKTLIVAEHFCFEDDETWRADDKQLTESTIHHLKHLGYINRNEVIDSIVIRLPKAYPLLEVGYKEYYDKVLDYLSRFKNLYITGRGGMFKYYNMDHAIESGIEAAKRIIKNDRSDIFSGEET